MEDKKLIPALRFKGFTGEWQEQTLGELTIVTMGQSPNGEYYTDNPNDFILVQGNADLNNGWVVPRIWTKQITKEAHINDLIFTVRAPVGAVGKTAYNVVIGRGVAAIKGNDFIYQSLIRMNDSGFWKKYSAGSTFDSINSDDLKSSRITHPDFNEQEAIGRYFASIDRLIVGSEAKLAKLKSVKKGCLEKMFPRHGSTTPALRFKGFTDEWQEQTLTEIGNHFNGLSGKSKSDFGHGDGKFITYMNVFTNPIADINRTENVEIDNKQNKVQYGDILFTVSSETPEEVGMSSIWLGKEDNIYLNSFCFGYRLTENKDPYYMAYLLRSSSIRKKIAFLAQGISRYNISKNRVLEISMPFPEMDEQKMIGNYFKDLDSQITKTEQHIEKLKNVKKACLDKMFV